MDLFGNFEKIRMTYFTMRPIAQIANAFHPDILELVT